MTGSPKTADRLPSQGTDGADPPGVVDPEGRERAPATWLHLAFKLALRACLNPLLAVDLTSMVWAFRARDWYRRPPFLPVPPAEYTRWRMYTAYGDEAAVPPVGDVIRFARWRREIMRR